MGYHKDIAPSADENAGAHVVHYYEFANTTDMNAGTDVQKGSVTFTAADIGRVARVGGAAPYDFYILQDHTGPTWEQVNGSGGGGGGGGDVTGPASATDNAIARFNGTGGKDIQNSSATVDDSGNLTVPGNIVVAGTVDGRDVAADGTKLDGIEAGATADQSAAEVPFTPNGDIIATNTQAAIVEVRDDTDTKLLGKLDTSHEGAGGAVHSVATAGSNGFMSTGDKSKLDGIEAGATADQDDSEVPLSGTIGTPTVDTLSERMDREGSPGLFSGGAITDDGDGTVTISALTGLIRATNSDTAPLLSFGLTAAGVTPTDNDITYIYVEYNGGSPQIVGSITEPTDVNTNLVLGTVHRSGTNLHITERQVRLPASIRDLHLRFLAVEGLKRASGGIVGETGTRNITVTEASLYLGLDPVTSLSGGFDSSGADQFFQFWRDGVGGWNLSFESQISNSEYDDGSGTLASLSGARRGVHWVYVGVDDHVYVIVGRGNYTNSQAQDARAPADLPPHMQENHAVLAAKIIIQNGASAFQSLESAFDIQFTGTGATDHGDLSGLSDDDHTQYLLVAGTRAMTGNLDMGAFAITNVGNVDGRDVSADGTKLDGIESGADVTDATNVAAAGAVMDSDFGGTDVGAMIRTGVGTYDIIQHNVTATAAPTASNDNTQGYVPGSLWVDLTNDQVYLCADNSTGAAVWRQVGVGGGGSLPTLDTLEGFTSGNRYDAAANGYAGVTTGFFFGALVEVRRLNASAGQSIWNNVNFGVDGWGLNIESNGRFQAYFIDTSGAQVATTAGGSDTLNDPAGAYLSSKSFIALGQVVQNGANNDVYLWVNGQKLLVGTGSNAYAPVTDIAQVGAGPFGNVAAETGIGGVCYYEGTLTDDEILDWFHECYDARDLVDNGIGMTIFSVKRGSPGATWTESDGTGPDLNRIGSLTTVNRDTVLWG